MAELKTKPTRQSVQNFLNETVSDEKKRKDCNFLLETMKEITGDIPRMWGQGIIGFGKYHYKYESGREGDWFLTGFSPRKQALTLYIMPGFKNQTELMQKLGKYKTGKACLYIKRLSDVDATVLKKLIEKSVAHLSGKAVV